MFALKLVAKITVFFISNFRHVLNAVCFLLGNSSGVWILYSDVSEHSVCSIFIPTCLWRCNWQCSETSAYKIQAPVNYPEESTQQMSHYLLVQLCTISWYCKTLISFWYCTNLISYLQNCNHFLANLSFLTSNFRRVLNVVCFLLGNSPGVWILYANVSKHSVCSIFIGR